MSNEIRPSESGKYLDLETWDALRAAGVSEGELVADQPFGPVVFSYTRAQAIEDGVLVDLTADGPDGAEIKAMCREAGFKLPIAMTTEAFTESLLAGTVEQDDGTFNYPSGQSLKGRLWDVLMLLRHAIRGGLDSDRVYFKVDVDAKGDGKHNTVSLWCQIGPGDTAAPVMTIMLEGQD